jgi:hypothetical protein
MKNIKKCFGGSRKLTLPSIVKKGEIGWVSDISNTIPEEIKSIMRKILNDTEIIDPKSFILLINSIIFITKDTGPLTLWFKYTYNFCYVITFSDRQDIVLRRNYKDTVLLFHKDNENILSYSEDHYTVEGIIVLENLLKNLLKSKEHEPAI